MFVIISDVLSLSMLGMKRQQSSMSSMSSMSSTRPVCTALLCKRLSSRFSMSSSPTPPTVGFSLRHAKMRFVGFVQMLKKFTGAVHVLCPEMSKEDFEETADRSACIEGPSIRESSQKIWVKIKACIPFGIDINKINLRLRQTQLKILRKSHRVLLISSSDDFLAEKSRQSIFAESHSFFSSSA